MYWYESSFRIYPNQMGFNVIFSLIFRRFLCVKKIRNRNKSIRLRTWGTQSKQNWCLFALNKSAEKKQSTPLHQPLYTSITRWNFYRTCTGGVMLFLIFFFSCLSMKHLHRVNPTFYANGVKSTIIFSFSSFSRSFFCSAFSLLVCLNFSIETHDDAIYILTFVLFAYMLFSFLHLFFPILLFFLSFSLNCKRTREKQRHINRGRWCRARCWFFPSFSSDACVCACVWDQCCEKEGGSNLDSSVLFSLLG